MGFFAKMPRWMLRIAVWILHKLDFYGKVPEFLVKTDPNYASVMISNLGSIGLKAGYHHLSNWGTNSIFVVMGEKKVRPVYDEEGNMTMKETLDLGLTLDERLADGYYYSKSVKLLKHLLDNPQLLERPAGEEVDYDKNENMNVKAPWIDHLDGIPAHLDYFQGSMYDKIAEVSENYPDYIAYDFMGGKVKYKDFISKVDKCARALAGIGVKPGESVTICACLTPLRRS